MEQTVGYQIDGKPYEGMLIFDERKAGKCPAILMQPDWKGVCPATVEQAKLVAGEDYVVFMADMFGAGYGEKPKTPAELMAAASALHENLPFTIAAGNKALEVMLAEGERLGVVDSTRIAIAGFCLGGGLALEHARTGAGFQAVIVFHVTYPNPVAPGQPCNIKGHVLTIHGSADPVTPKAAVDALEIELTKANVPWQTVMFGGAVHSFTDPTVNSPGRNVYDPALARRSYTLLHDFLAERFIAVAN